MLLFFLISWVKKWTQVKMRNGPKLKHPKGGGAIMAPHALEATDAVFNGAASCSFSPWVFLVTVAIWCQGDWPLFHLGSAFHFAPCPCMARGTRRYVLLSLHDHQSRELQESKVHGFLSETEMDPWGSFSTYSMAPVSLAGGPQLIHLPVPVSPVLVGCHVPLSNSGSPIQLVKETLLALLLMKERDCYLHRYITVLGYL